MENKASIAWAAFFGMTGVILGALGAHALEAKLEPDSLESFTTGVRYQVWHAIALLIIGISSTPLKYHKIISVLWIAGIFLFSGSIFVLSTAPLLGVNVRVLGPVTPLGGLALIAGWFLLLLSALQHGKKKI